MTDASCIANACRSKSVEAFFLLFFTIALHMAVIGFLVTLSTLVLVHEWGHYIVARWCGVKVLAFSIGFGKTLYKRTDKRGCEWRISAIPFGGYVSMLDEGMQQSDVDAHGLTPEEFKRQSFSEKPVGKRIAVVAAGPLMNFLLAIVIYAAIAMVGTYQPSNKLAEPLPGTQAAELGVQQGWRAETVEGMSTATFNDMRMAMLAHLGEKEVRIRFEEPSGRKTELTFDLTSVKTDGTQDAAITTGLFPYQGPVTLVKVEPNSAAAQAGLEKGDAIVAVDGEPVRSMQSLVASVRDKAAVPMVVTYDRAGVRGTVTVTPQTKNDETGRSIGFLGVMFTAEPDLVYTREGPIGALVKGVSDTWRLTVLTVKSLSGLFTGAVSTDSLGGPVLIGEMAGEAMSFGVISYLLFLALISVNLGILNLLPVPVLDGGHLLFYCYEIVTGRKPGEKMRKYGLYVGMAFILGLTFFALGNDITRILK